MSSKYHVHAKGPSAHVPMNFFGRAYATGRGRKPCEALLAHALVDIHVFFGVPLPGVLA